MNKETELEEIMQRKCFHCYKKDECMLFSGRHAGIELCLGCFDNQEDSARKVREDFERDKKRALLDRIAWGAELNSYRTNMESFDKKRKSREKKTVKRKPAAASLRQLLLEWDGSGRRDDKE